MIIYKNIAITTIIIVILMISGILCAGDFSASAQASAPSAYMRADSVSAPYSIRVSRASTKALQLAWTKVSTASGYEIFRHAGAGKGYVRIKTINGAHKIQWTDKNLRANKKYSYKVRTYIESAGKRVYGAFTYAVSAITDKTSCRKANAGAIDSVKSLNIGINQAVAINAVAMPSIKDRKAGKKVLSPKVRLVVTASGYAKKDQKRRLVGVMPGNANAYLVAHNGYKKKLNVHVVDYGTPKKWENLDGINSYAARFLTEYTDDITAIASYMSRHRSKKEGDLYINSSGTGIINLSGVDMGDVEKNICNIILDSPYRVVIYVYADGSIEFTLVHPYNNLVNFMMLFDTQKDVSRKEAEKHNLEKIAPHWVYWMETGSGI
jgi:hypothetical protein